MKSKACCVILILLSFLVLGMNRTTLAADLALEKLLTIFQEKGVITEAEVELVKETMAEERRQLLKKEEELEERQKRLVKWEEELTDKANALEAEKRPQEQGREAGIPLEATYRNGFCLQADELDLFTLCLGGLLQADYRYFDYVEDDPNKNEFDLRRVRLRVDGQALHHFDYKFEYEFQGAGSRNLLDPYVDAKNRDLKSTSKPTSPGEKRALGIQFMVSFGNFAKKISSVCMWKEMNERKGSNQRLAVYGLSVSRGIEIGQHSLQTIPAAFVKGAGAGILDALGRVYIDPRSTSASDELFSLLD